MVSDASSPADSSLLSFMQPLSPTVAYFDPHDELDASDDPHLILLLSWMAARDEHIEKYIVQYRAIYPKSRILLIRCPLSRVWLPWLARRDMRPALPLLRALCLHSASNKAASQRPRLLVHMFSNGGVSSAVHLLSLLKQSCSKMFPDTATHPLPRYVLLMDSCPGYFRWRNTHRALVQTLPWWTSPLMHLAIATACLYHFLRRLPPAQNQNARALRSPRLLQYESRRTYLYGTADNVVDYRDVESNAAKAREGGFNVYTKSFEGAKHVALARSDPQQYWQTVRQSWSGKSSRLSGQK
ncbi:hypothetical protein CDD82_3967 [Ophiocordyceps australis]|uniref:Indole-diterpene biosynthesis protein PaxU n=1 Tax=Ophiocordyceps australis TaxID=1399860 RepID=A0A2C5Z9M8_9HYPO|nr:hypothetical protein CDD82_3967 [Ophiocordyceps australis]